MNHKINDMEMLARNATELRTVCIEGGDGDSATAIVNSLTKIVNNLKSSWKGRDAEVQINNVIDVSNGMIDIRSNLGKIASASSSAVQYYRDIQTSNAAESINDVDKGEAEKMSKIDVVQDKRDMIDITPEAAIARDELSNAINKIDGLKTTVSSKFRAITDNWQAGVGRDEAMQAYSGFEDTLSQYTEILSNVQKSVSTALTNYSM